MISKTSLQLEAESFDKIVSERIKKGFNPDCSIKKNYKFFYNNPWRYPITTELCINGKIKEIIKFCKKKSKILDVGCGLGTLSFELAKKNCKVDAIDISKKSIFYAKKFAKKNLSKKQYDFINFKCTSLDEYLKNNKKGFDSIVFFKTLHHLKNTKKVLKLVKKNLKINGYLIIVEPFRNDFEYINAVIAYIIRTLCINYQKRDLKIKKNSEKEIEQNINEILKEYKYESDEKGYDQSPNDNILNDSLKLKKLLKVDFNIFKEISLDSFRDKILGSIRGKDYLNEIKLINNLDKFLINKKILKGTTKIIVAKLKRTKKNNSK